MDIRRNAALLFTGTLWSKFGAQHVECCLELLWSFNYANHFLQCSDIFLAHQCFGCGECRPASQPPVEAAASAVVQEQRNDRVNLNTADALTLQKELAGIGKNKADAIVAYRESNGEFTSVDELIEVKGIGKAILERNRDKLAID